jgi:hypothetical protein
LADDLKDERPERVERRKLVDSRPRMEVRVGIDHPCEHWVGIEQDIARARIGGRCGRAVAGVGRCGQL